MAGYSMRVFWSESDGAFIAVCPEFGDLSAFGATQQEAVSELQVALDLAKQAYAEDGRPLPAPQSEVRRSGQLRLRLPRQLHAEATELAHREGVSLNTLVVSVLAKALGRASVGARGTRRVQGRRRDGN